MRKILLIMLLAGISGTVAGQQQTAGQLVIHADLSALKEQPLKVLLTKRGVGDYMVPNDTCKITGKTFHYETKIPEPEFIRLTFYWRGGRKLTSTSFWATSSSYELTIDDDLKPHIVPAVKPDVATEIDALEKKVIYLARAHSDSLAKTVSYEHKKIEEAENRIYYIRDSIANVIDENIYKQFILTHLNSPAGLYALCNYAERPYTNQRINSQPQKIEELFNQLDAGIKQMPSAKLLVDKLAFGKQMAMGKVLKDISLPDTAGKIFKLSNFKGKYVLVDFWASWCTPCRQESPALISAYKKYKDSGFQIISVSRDQRSAKEEWLQAIKKDHTSLWPQLSDFDNLAQKTYSIRFLPANYLINPEGIIIARDLRGGQLEKELEKIFK